MGYCPRMAEVVYEKDQYHDPEFGDPMQTRIREYRARHSMTQEYLAKAVGVRRETVVFLEQGKYNPSLKLAHDVARTLQARIDDLFIFDDDTPEPEIHEILVD